MVIAQVVGTFLCRQLLMVVCLVITRWRRGDNNCYNAYCYKLRMLVRNDLFLTTESNCPR